MIKTIFSNYEFEKSDYAKIYAEHFIAEFDSMPKTKIFVNFNTDHGFTTKEKISLVSGIYLLYKSNTLIYVGKSDHCIHQRIGRFLAGVRGTERLDENHSAAYKYVDYFGRDTTNLSFKYIKLAEPGEFVNLDHHVTLQDIEEQIIRIMDPLFNRESFENFDIKKLVEILHKDKNVSERISV